MNVKLSIIALSMLTALPAWADMVHITADRDNTLIEDPNGAASSGVGPNFRAGRTNQGSNSIRRGLVRFDVAGALPEGALVDRVFVTLYENASNVEPREVGLHLVLSDWGEGASFSAGGQGAPAEPGDATWLHTFYDYDYWHRQGGDFVPHASATVSVSGNDFHTWQSTPQLVANVRKWQHNPQRNFGWAVIGDEDARQTAKRFSSREAANPVQWPTLTIEYHLPGN